MNDKILLVDDEAKVLAAIKRQLRKKFSIETAQSGEEALRIIDEKGPFARSSPAASHPPSHSPAA